MTTRRKQLAERRKSCGFTQDRLAEGLGVDVTTVRRWEAGSASPQPRLRPKIAQVLSVPSQWLEDVLQLGALKDVTADREPEAVPATYPDHPGSQPPVDGASARARPVLTHRHASTGLQRSVDSEGPDTCDSPAPALERNIMTPLDRRSLLKQGLAAAALPAIGPPEMHQIIAAINGARENFDGSGIKYFRHELKLCKSTDGSLDSGPNLFRVLGIIGTVEEQAREAKADDRRQLLKVGSEAAEFAGWLYRDAGDVPRALFWHDRAIEWAQEANDTVLQGYVLLKKAQLAYDDREPMRMLTLAQAAQDGSWHLPLRVQAEAVQQEARAEAMLGASLGAVQRKLDQA
jgi:transcriptional regulator with XRE-family HTH domain